MSIKAQLRLAAWLPALFGLVVATALWVSWGGVDRARARAGQAELIERSITELNALIQEYLLFGGARVTHQLAGQRAALAELLAPAEPGAPAELKDLQALRRGESDLDRLLALLLEGRSVSRDQIAGALLVKVHDLRFKAGLLAQRENQAVVQIQRQVDHLILAVLAVLTLFSFTLLTWLSRRLTRGLDRLGTGMRQVEGGDLDHRLPVEQGDEFGRLADTFNGMTERLRDSRRLVGERTAQLEAANADLESFSYSVSHDLRAPLRAIDGFAAILREDYAARLDVEGVRLLGVVSDNAVRMGRLIDDILAFSRAGRQGLRYTELDMLALVQEVWTSLAHQRAGREVELRVAELPPAWGDPGAIRQVWLNLLGNALKFSQRRDQALIEVTGRREAGERCYSVTDNGAGFDPAYSGKLFGLFHRLHGMDEFEGTGVGLAIVKRFVEKHGGGVAGSGRPDAGATFSFSLPAGREAADPPVAATGPGRQQPQGSAS
ncbi:MAG TPA: ATP-binding protein [Lamprocystis sp. (in: g-proteobacteria)]|nr:ATP-binding protein [Lamprocystis sp. (in: g-proteobacteria)]